MGSRNWLKIEGAALALLCGVMAWHWSVWDLFGFWLIPLLLWPDLAILAYLVSASIGAFFYNLFHTTTLPILFLIAFWFMGLATPWLLIPILWLFHISIDRVLGFGLKTGKDFKDTHLGRF